MELPTVRSLVYDNLGGAIVNLLDGTFYFLAFTGQHVKLGSK